MNNVNYVDDIKQYINKWCLLRYSSNEYKLEDGVQKKGYENLSVWTSPKIVMNINFE